jgi:hypothetical protein
LELEIEKRDNAELIQIVITIGVHWSRRSQRDPEFDYQWSPFEPIWSSRLIREEIMGRSRWGFPLESIGVGD